MQDARRSPGVPSRGCLRAALFAGRLARLCRKKVRKGSLLICTASGSKSHLGKVAYVDEDYGYAFGGFMGQITPVPGIHERYLFHVLTSPAYKSFLCELIVDCEHKTAPTQEHGYPSIRTPNIGKGKLILDGANRVSEETYTAWTRRAVPLPGDLILAREAAAGNVAVVPDGMQVCLGQRTVLLRPRRDVFEPEYLAHLLLQRSSQRRLLAHSRGATVQHANMKDIRAFMLGSVPSLDVQRKVVDKLAEVDQMCESLEATQRQKLAALDELKNSLPHQAFSGSL